MNRVMTSLFLLLVGIVVPNATAQEPQKIKGPDERYKLDILVVVAHPDDEGGVTPYLARAIYDLHKSVGVVFGTRGGSGGNDYRREHGPALADVREIEARRACAGLGIDKVWFLGGKDTASQNVLNSLANWGHGESLEELVRIVRLTRPEIIISWLPSIFIGENHGDHQASGVLATEAFDLAADPTAFPAQLAGASKRLEPYLENLTPWQPKKIYYFSDARDLKQFVGKGFAYSVREISPSQKKPYWLLAMNSAKLHLTQFPEEAQRMAGMSEAEIEKLMSDPKNLWWPEPETLIYGKGVLPFEPTSGVFDCLPPQPCALRAITRGGSDELFALHATPASVSLGGPWAFYEAFRKKHGLQQLPVAKTPEIAIKTGTVLAIPLLVTHSDADGFTIKVQVHAPEGWKVLSGEGAFALPAEGQTDLRVEVQTPESTREQLKDAAAQSLLVQVSQNGNAVGDVKLNVLLTAGGLPQ